MITPRMKIKKIIIFLSIIMIFIILPFLAGYIETHYTREGSIIEINKKDNIIKIKDTSGYYWEYQNKDNYRVGDKVRMAMYSSHTDNNIYDDVILKIELITN